MKVTNYFFCIVLFIYSCQIKNSEFDAQLTQSSQRLSQLSSLNTQDTLLLQGVFDSAYQTALKVSTRQHDSLFAVISRFYGNQFYGINDTKAKSIYEKGLAIGLRQLVPTDNIIGRLYGNIANIYYMAGDYKTAVIYFDSIKIVSQDSASYQLKIKNAMLIADSYKRLKETKSAERIFKDIEPLANNYFSKADLASFFTQYAATLQDLKNYKEAVEKAEKGVSILQLLAKDSKLTNMDSIYLSTAYIRLAFVLHDSGVYTLAEQYYKEALSINKKQNQWSSYRRILSNMGSMYRANKQLRQAEDILTTGLLSFDKSNMNNSATRLKASFYVNRSEVYLETKQYQKAIADQDSAIHFFTLYDKKPSLTAVMMQARPILLSVLSDKARACIALAENGSDTEGYQKALKLTQQITELSDDIRTDYFSDDAKLTLANDIKPAFEKAIALCHQLYQKTKDPQYLEKAFNFVEYSRSMVLYENARLDNQLPPELKAENEELKKREAALIAKNNVEDLQNYLRLKRQFREKIKALNRNQLASVATCQTELLKDNQTAFVEYFVGDSTIFVFTLLKNGLNLYEIHKPKDFEQKIETLREGITQKRPVHDATDFAKQSAELYTLLGQECLGNLPSSISKLIIAPDGVLAYLPFELLLKSAPSSQNFNKKQRIDPIDFRQIDYLLKHYQISYAYSANLLLAQKQIKKHNTSRLFAGFAPEYQAKDTAVFAMTSDNTRAVLTRKEAYALGGAKREVQAISELVGGNAFLRESATEGVFKKESNKYRILHFAMHSITDDKDPLLSKLLFTLSSQDTTEDNDLNASEIYTLQLNADLAVLSACNTGYGKLNKGEGVMSLARAFSYAGVPATVTSLWKASDLTTPEIMLDFYKNLKLRMPKDAALHQAKLTYLKDAPESVAANPYFWAAFVPLGNMEAMDMSNSTPLSIWAIAIGLTALFSVGFWLWKVKFTKLK